jgi:phosphohistidine swiveling domain-containing protein
MWTKAFAEITDRDRALAGGKGFALARLARLGVPVPPGFVVTTVAYAELLRSNSLDAADPAIAERLEYAALPDGLEAEIAQRLAGLHGAHFAVRSSAVGEDAEDKSFAGIFESYLQVPAALVAQHLRKCYAAMFSARASHYLGTAQPMAVVVQEMVSSRLSGVLFTKDPINPQGDVMLVECCQGLGELLVSGEITPERYCLDKTTGVIVERNAGTQPVKLAAKDDGTVRLALDGSERPISARELRTLAAIARRIERHFAAACDIEWCIDDRGIFVVQSRPITAVAAPQALHGTAPPQYTKRFFSRILSPVFEEANVRGFHHYAQDQFELPFGLSGYHVYQPSVNHPGGEVDIWVDEGLDQRVKGWMKKAVRFDSDYLGRLEQRYIHMVDLFSAFCETAEGQNYQEVPSGYLIKLLTEFDTINQRMTSFYNAPIFVINALAELVNEEMHEQNPASYDQDFATLALAGIPNSVFFQEAEFLKILLVAKERYGYAEWSPRVLQNAEVREMLAQYHRRWRFLACTDVIGEAFSMGHFEDLLAARYDQDTRFKWRTLAEKQKQEALDVEEVRQRYLRLHYEVNWLRRWVFHRNHTTEYYYRDFQCLKGLLQEIGARLGLSYRELLNLSVDEMIQALGGSPGGCRERAVARGADGFSLHQHGDAVMLRAGIAPQDRLETSIVRHNELEGQIANRGTATGTARIIRDPVREAARFQVGDILVTAMTAPSFVPLMEKAAAIVTDEGGILCHAALVSREMNKPCIISVRNATQVISDGALVTVTGETGRILVHSRD